MTKTYYYHLIIGVSDLCCKVVKRKSTCKTSCLLTAEHCLLAKVKARWEEGNLPLRDDYGILRTLKATLAAFKKQRGRKHLTVEEKMPLIDQMTSSTLDLSPRYWKKLINQDRSLMASWPIKQNSTSFCLATLTGPFIIGNIASVEDCRASRISTPFSTHF